MINNNKIYFEKLEEYINFTKKYSSIILPLINTKTFGDIILDGEKWDIYPHGMGANMINKDKNIDIEIDFIFDGTRIYYNKWKFHNFLENVYQRDKDFSNIFSKERKERFLEYEQNHNFLCNKNWISYKKGLKGGFYISKSIKK